MSRRLSTSFADTSPCVSAASSALTLLVSAFSLRREAAVRRATLASALVAKHARRSCSSTKASSPSSRASPNSCSHGSLDAIARLGSARAQRGGAARRARARGR
jgi:hypothetical protein